MLSRGHDTHLRGLPRVLVHQNEHFTGNNLFFERDHATELANRVRLRAPDEGFSREVLTVHTQWHRKRYAGRATPLDSTIVRHGHMDFPGDPVSDTMAFGGAPEGGPSGVEFTTGNRRRK